MKKLVAKKVIESTVVDDPNEGLVSLMGQRVTLFCVNYIYTGELVGVNTVDVKLEKAAIVYETGPLGDKNWKDAQSLPNAVYVKTAAIESYMILK